MKTSRMIGQAARGLNRNRLRTFFMMAGIMVGITVLTTVLSAGMGARERIMERVRVFGLENIMIWAGGATDQVRSVPGSGSGSGSGSEVTATLKLEDAEAVYTEIQGIRLAAPFARSGQSEAQWRDRNFASPMFGVTPEWVDVWDWPVGVGSFITQQDVESNSRIAAIGPTVVRELSLRDRGDHG